MGEYFKSWRRRCGLVVLGLACVFVFAWVRGFYTEDTFESTSLVPTPFGFIFDNGPLIVHSGLIDAQGVIRTEATLCGPNAVRLSIDAPNWVMEIAEIHHWSIVIPLTLLSAYLLLWKPTAKLKHKATAVISN